MYPNFLVAGWQVGLVVGRRAGRSLGVRGFGGRRRSGAAGRCLRLRSGAMARVLPDDVPWAGAIAGG